jgi:hypothetical protein
MNFSVGTAQLPIQKRELFHKVKASGDPPRRAGTSFSGKRAEEIKELRVPHAGGNK